jgi:hypothetical protein
MYYVFFEPTDVFLPFVIKSIKRITPAINKRAATITML